IEGVGHYEPLRHYAGVHLLLEPAALGSGIQFSSACLEDTLAKHWQRLIRLHVCEKEHLGVLTGSPITDIKITLLAGKAHLKHTEGGDFREATYRAIRQGLKATRSILLEPYYHFRLEVPTSSLSKAIYDLELMKASFHIQDRNGASILEGKAPVAKMQNYQSQLITYTKGKGKLFCILKGYEPVREDEMETIIAKINYDSERDVENPTGSIFCKQGAGFYVPWDKVYEYMHMKACWQKKEESNYASEKHNKVTIDEKELARVMERTYGVNKSKLRKETAHSNEVKKDLQYVKRLKPCLLVDGYNMIHSWDLLKEIANDHLDAARHRLIHLLSSYQGFKKCLLILVFDAYQVEDSKGTSEYNGSIHIIYTKKAQTADSYIEKASHDLSDQYQVSVATSDGLEQLIVLGQKARRISSQELEKEVLYLTKTNLETYEKRNQKGFHQPLAKLRKLNED
ncbi:MAG: translation elongation factor G, partial [Erysipelotrichia bacterium]|nr:translation elongation factor G [Erysipelotrichia bacterium]